MKTIDLSVEQIALTELISLALDEPVLLLTPDGHEFLLSEADDFDDEVAQLQASETFQRFLDQRSASKDRVSLEDVLREIELEIAST